MTTWLIHLNLWLLWWFFKVCYQQILFVFISESHSFVGDSLINLPAFPSDFLTGFVANKYVFL